MTVVESAQRFGAASRTRRTVRLIVISVLVVLVALAVWAVWFSSWFAVREVRVLGAVRVSVDTVRTAAAVPAAVPLARVDVDGVTSRVAAIPEVASVEVRRGWPDVLVVVVTERVPVAVVRGATGWSFVDAGGVRFGSATVPPAGLPPITASSDPALESAAAVVAALPPTIGRTVSGVSARTRDNVVLTLLGGSSVQWGSAEDSPRKAAVLASLLHVRARSYDVSAPDLPTTRGTVPLPAAS
jgi:cell division protein FtsQ